MLRAIWAVRAFSILCVAVGAYAAWVSIAHIRADDAADPWLLPAGAGLGSVALGIAVCLCETSALEISGRVLSRRVGVMALLLLYAFVLLPYGGFLFASAVLVLAVALLYAGKPRIVGIGGLAIVVVIWAVFADVIATPLPEGLWWQ